MAQSVPAREHWSLFGVVSANAELSVREPRACREYQRDSTCLPEACVEAICPFQVLKTELVL